MTDVTISREENKVSNFLKDESGMTLVELLATVVILAIIAGIGVTAIGKVIQNSREDAGIANMQQAMNAAKLYQSSNLSASAGVTTFTLKEVDDSGYYDVPDNTFSTGGKEKVVFKVGTDGNLTISYEADILTAGQKKNKAKTDMTTSQLLAINRKDFWN